MKIVKSDPMFELSTGKIEYPARLECFIRSCRLEQLPVPYKLSPFTLGPALALNCDVSNSRLAASGYGSPLKHYLK